MFKGVLWATALDHSINKGGVQGSLLGNSPGTLYKKGGVLGSLFGNSPRTLHKNAGQSRIIQKTTYRGSGIQHAFWAPFVTLNSVFGNVFLHRAWLQWSRGRGVSISIFSLRTIPCGLGFAGGRRGMDDGGRTQRTDGQRTTTTDDDGRRRRTDGMDGRTEDDTTDDDGRTQFSVSNTTLATICFTIP